jgi:hypothetical protein
MHLDIHPPLYVTRTDTFVMLFRGDFGAIMHIDIHPPLYVTRTDTSRRLRCYHEY